MLCALCVLVVSGFFSTLLGMPSATPTVLPCWLTAALQEVKEEPQIEALCWFVDLECSGADTWDWFSLAKKPGRLIYAAEEFDQLLRP